MDTSWRVVVSEPHVLRRHRPGHGQGSTGCCRFRSTQSPVHAISWLSPVLGTGNLRQRIQLLIVSQCYGGLFCGKMRHNPPHDPPTLSETIAKNRSSDSSSTGHRIGITMLYLSDNDDKRGAGFTEVLIVQSHPVKTPAPCYISLTFPRLSRIFGLGAVIAAGRTIVTLLLQSGTAFRIPH